MSRIESYARMKIKRSIISGAIPTIPLSLDHTDGSWLSTDIYEGELFLNIPDKRLFTRTGSTILEISAGKFRVSQTDPSLIDDLSHNYTLGYLWYNNLTEALFILVDPTANNAIWFRISSHEIDASQIISGKISLERLPSGALERRYYYTGLELTPELFNLTTLEVQTGDVVQINNINNENNLRAWVVINDELLDQSLGFTDFVSFIYWSSIIDIPLELLIKRSPIIISNVTLDSTYNYIICNSSSDIEVILPSVTTIKKIIIKNISPSLVTVKCFGSETIDLIETEYILEQYDRMELISNNLNWEL